jgi:hypothetical protein
MMGLGLSLGLISSSRRLDPDAAAYIAAVEEADVAVLETGVKTAIDAFVRGCKSDGIWTAIKASCILAGARTLTGALVPLAGAAPTSFNFVSGDYNRKTGLVGNGTTKYLNSNRDNAADPQNNRHLAVFQTQDNTYNVVRTAIGSAAASAGASRLDTTNSQRRVNLSSGSLITNLPFAFQAGLWGASRNSGADVEWRYGGSTTLASVASVAPLAGIMAVFSANTPSNFTNGRLAFYSIGESLDLAKLDARVTALINAYGAAIP